MAAARLVREVLFFFKDVYPDLLILVASEQHILKPYSIVPIHVSTPKTVDITSGIGFEKVLAGWNFIKNNVLADTFCVFNPSAYT